MDATMKYAWPDGTALPPVERFADPDDLREHARAVAAANVWATLADAERWLVDMLKLAHNWQQSLGANCCPRCQGQSVQVRRNTRSVHLHRPFVAVCRQCGEEWGCPP